LTNKPTNKPSPPPKGLSRRSADLWRRLVAENDFTSDSIEMLERALRSFDVADELLVLARCRARFAEGTESARQCPRRFADGAEADAGHWPRQGGSGCTSAAGSAERVQLVGDPPPAAVGRDGVTAHRRPPQTRALAPALVRYLATGSYAEADLDTFIFAGHVMRFATGGPAGEHYRAAAAELRRLWRDHKSEICAAADREPWCATWLREHPQGALAADPRRLEDEQAEARRLPRHRKDAGEWQS